MNDKLDYDQKVKLEIERNQQFLDLFRKRLEDTGLSKKTIRKHIDNVAFYLNEYLTYYEIYPMEDGHLCMNEFFSDYFIEKCSWSSPSNIKATAASLRKFYYYMAIEGKVPKATYVSVDTQINQYMDQWIDAYFDYYGEELYDLF